MTRKSGAKFEEKLTCGLQNDIKKLVNIHQHSKISKLGLLWCLFIQSRKCIKLEFTGEFCVMTMKDDVKFEKELTCQFKIDVTNLTNFDLSTQNSQKFTL